MPLSMEQKNVLRDIAAWLSSGRQQTLTLGGYAGTGKTTVVAALRLLLKKQRPNWRVAFAAYTGKATQVLAEKLARTKLELSKDTISTLHSLLYEPLTGPSGRITGWNRKNTIPYDLLIVDEASMLTREMWQDIKGFGVPVLAVGDHGQLPPIGDNFDLMKAPQLRLTTIHRQAEESPIIHVATLAREQGHIPVEKFGPKVRKYDMTGSDAQLLIEELYQSYRPDTLFLTGFNDSRIGIN
ncbi:AAA family ATPase, partial [Candidatus Woesebacteria bacterium]|nr:AAA family ATPase [Candidatus Woesebacteria bacterium]